MRSNSEYRAIARQAMNGHWTEAALIMLLVCMIACAFAVPAGVLDKFSGYGTIATLNGLSSLASIFLLVPLGYGLSNALLSLLRNTEERPSLMNDMLAFFKNDYSRSLPALLLAYLFEVLLGCITLGIGTIILTYCYAMVPYLVRDYPEIGAREALRISKDMMNGHKWDLFMLHLSFIGWFFVGCITFGIGFLWISPYINMAQAAFYEDLKAETIVEE